MFSITIYPPKKDLMGDIMICKIQECTNSVFVKQDQLCKAHYMRKWRYGDPLFIKTDYALKGKNHPNFKHGAWGQPLFKTWTLMLSRCYNKNDKIYYRYGAKGIFICDRWRYNFWNFKNDMGERPPNHTLDRINSRDGYYPENCRWANYTIQGRNRPSFVKLSIEKAKEIRRLPRRGKNGRGPGYTRQEIADMYDVSLATIKKVVSGAYWKEQALFSNKFFEKLKGQNKIAMKDNQNIDTPIVLTTEDGIQLELTEWGFYYDSCYILKANHMFRMLKQEKERREIK